MKRNTFYLFIGILVLLEVGAFWLAVENAEPLLIQIALPVGVAAFFLVRTMVEEPIQDERTNVITQKAAVATLTVFWVVFFVTSIGSVVYGFNEPLGIHPPPLPHVFESKSPPPMEAASVGDVVVSIPNFGRFGMVQLFLLAFIIILYAVFRLYYARQYGEWEQDEE